MVAEALTIGGLNAADFTVTTAPAALVMAGSTTTVQITFDPSAPGLRSATFSLVNNDSNENPFTFSIQGTGQAPEIAVSGNATDIVSGDNTPSLSDHTDFGSTLVAGGTVVRTYTIANVGSSDLTLGSLSIGGLNAADFTVTTPPAAPGAPS